MNDRWLVVDLFAGPGGLGEGFNEYRRPGSDARVFRTSVSIEKDHSAARTLRFRAFMRKVSEAGLELNLGELAPNSPRAEEQFLEAAPGPVRNLWDQTRSEALTAELGGDKSCRNRIDRALGAVRDECVLIGGPPCQAYSLVGRSRNLAINGYSAKDDHRHFLYTEYVDILHRMRPIAFVMENVKGILSAKVEKAGIFSRIAEDLEAAGYVLCPLAPRTGSQLSLGGRQDPYEFIIRAEEFGIPQARHRVIVVGIRRDVVEDIERRVGRGIRDLLAGAFGDPEPAVPVCDVLAGLPPLRSRLSRRKAKPERSWADVVNTFVHQFQESRGIREAVPHLARPEFLRALDALQHQDSGIPASASPALRAEVSPDLPHDLALWLRGKLGGRIFNHEARSHMDSDLGRYLFASVYAAAVGVSPKAPDFPEELAPAHQNWMSGKFADRFRTQLADQPATTITSHISKDGHYFIHPDPAQCRSLTVREAARIQTFPDDYIFFGNRTQQYIQVGNAVPPFLALRIARALDKVLLMSSAP